MFELSKRPDFYNISLRLRADEEAVVKKELDRLGVSRSDFLRLCIQAYFEKLEKEKT